jgi:hypothetical protein
MSIIRVVMMSNAVKTTDIAMIDSRLMVMAAIGGTTAKLMAMAAIGGTTVMMTKARVAIGAVDIAIVG